MYRRTIASAGVVLALALGLAGCTDDTGTPEPTGSASPSTAPTAEPVTPPEGSTDAAGSVDWAKYDPTAQGRIDALATAADCAGLHAEFDQAMAADASMREATGSGTEDLLSYIDDRLQDADCG